jgi:hypothetical protein
LSWTYLHERTRPNYTGRLNRVPDFMETRKFHELIKTADAEANKSMLPYFIK